ncbi:MAG: decaprenyl-phosphate phosphoribosyltransferase [Rhodospirillales bacterium]|nr:decaprenyl-phosphate phosphoribosyltransferase [Rhodospirillales bacterium]
MPQPAALVRLIRPHQWIKNGFVVMPLVFTPGVMNPDLALLTGLGALCFCLISSAVYCLNDVVDIERDRLHPTKQTRPLPSGAISRIQALALALVLFLAGIIGAYWIDAEFAIICSGYGLLNVLYSLWLKNYSIIDVMIIAIGFVLRIYAGSAIIELSPSVWIVVSTGLLALFLALQKRRGDLTDNLDENHRASIRGYNLQFIDTATTMILGALLVSYVIYTTDSSVIEKLGTDKFFLTIPFVVAGIFRYLQAIYVEQQSGDPTLIILTDRILALIVLVWLAVVALLIYA